MLKPSPLFTDSAVLCRRKEIRIFGEVSPGQTVTAAITDRQGKLLAEGSSHETEGRFMVPLRPLEAQMGCRLTITAGGERFTAENIALGDVFLAGGQSNMELALCNALEGPEMIAVHDDPLLRFFNVPKKAYVSPEQQETFGRTRWQAVRPGCGGENSAVASFFASTLRKKHPEIPLGIIGCYWGGTSITCWMETDTLRTLSEGLRYLEEDARKTAGKTMETYLAEEALFQEGLDRWNQSVEAYRSDHPGAPWQEIEKACGMCPWCPPAGPGSPYRPGGLVAPMLACVAPFTLTGILYYQGEEDTGKTDHYDVLMAALIRRWRQLFMDAELPFLFVQLPMWLDFGAKDTFRWPLTRLAQAAARDAVRNTGLICLLDEGEYGNIHPVNKRPVGERLAELAGAMLYDGGEVSPRAVSKFTEGSILTVCCSAPLITRDGQAPRLLEIAEAAGEFVPAEAEIAGSSLLLRNPSICHPVRARYAWTDYSAEVNLAGENQLPLEPFWLE